MEKVDARKLKTEAQQLNRNQVIRLRNAGKIYNKISVIIGIHVSTACMLYKAYESGGRKAIKLKKRGRPKGSCRTLDPEQEKRLKKAITDKTPDQLKFSFALWTRRAVQHWFMIYNQTMHSHTFIKFHKRLIKDTDNKVFLIFDNLRVHQSHIVKAGLSKIRKRSSCFSFLYINLS